MSSRLVYTVLSILMCAAVAENGYQHPIRGTVYVDANANGKRDEGETGRAGVVVSDGFGVVRTDASGGYELANTDRDARFVFVHQPGDVKQNGQTFFRRLSKQGSAEERHDLGLVPAAPGENGNGVRFVQLTDSHIRGVSDRDYMQEATREIYEMNPPPDFVVATGDLVDWGVDEHFQNYVAGMQKPPVPYFNVFGNHEIYRGPIERYHEYIGPDYYSFERGGILFLALNCVTKSARQDAWLAETLKLLGKDRPVVVMQHFPPTPKEMENFAGLGVKSVFSGHWHSEKEMEHAGVQNINSPTFIMGGIDASPAGFKVVQLSSNGVAETEWRYGFQKQRLTIVSPQQGSPVSGSYFPIVVNAYDTTRDVASVEWKVREGQKQVSAGELKRESALSWAGAHRHPGMKPGTYHFHVEVKDEHGRTWTKHQEVDASGKPPAVPKPAGEWPMFMGDPAHTGCSANAIATPLRLVWSVDTGGDADFTSPILADGRIYLGLKKRTRARSNGVAAFDPLTGKRLWKFATDMAVNHTPAYADGIVCVAEQGGRVHGIDAATGKPKWHHDLMDSRGRYSYCAPVVQDGAFFAGVLRFASRLNVRDGKAAWALPLGKDTDWLPSYSSPAVAGGFFALGGMPGRSDALVVANVADGTKVWGHAANGGLLGSPTIAGDRLLFCSKASILYCCALKDGAELWHQELGAREKEPKWSATTPAVKLSGNGQGIVVAGSGDGEMSGIDLADGRVLWTHQSDPTVFKVSPYRRDERPLLSSPTIAGDKVFFGSADGRVYGLELETGKRVWSYHIGAPVMSTPLVSGNALYVAAYDGRLYAFTAD